ncbi:unnamed protein product [Brachionus calyciflorus]|uniref:OTU domain-containing protein n=1 Tax=Brachionus calyciflorus TaxID=104777 RepID=A0A813WCC6_9BILA|nr:unnamed protein product [Brachionus calyciflorus]
MTVQSKKEIFLEPTKRNLSFSDSESKSNFSGNEFDSNTTDEDYTEESNDSGPKAGSDNSGPKAGSDNSGPKAGSDKSGPKTGSDNSGPKAGSDNSGPKALPYIIGPQIGSNIRDPQTGTNIKGSNIIFDLLHSYNEIDRKKCSFSEIQIFMKENRRNFLNLVDFLSSKSIVLFSNQEKENNPKFLEILKQTKLERYHFIIKSKLDGNCFYNAISTCFFGNEENSLLIKLGSIFIMLENEILFRRIIVDHYYNESFEKIVCDSFSKNSWAMMLNIYATSILINRPILSFNLNHETLKVYIQKYLYRKSALEPVLIAFYINHFCPILCSEKDQLDYQSNIKQIDLFINYRN